MTTDTERAQVGEGADGVTVASEHQAVRGVFAGESMAKAAEGWAAWCERRHLSSLSEFLIDVSRALGVAGTFAGQREGGTDAA